MADDRNDGNPDAQEVDALVNGDDLDKAVADAFAASEPEAAVEPEGGRARDEHGRFTSKDGGGEPAGPPAEADDETGDEPVVAEQDSPGEGGGDDVPASLDPPHHWSAADQELFRSQPPATQQWMLERHKQMEADYTGKTQEVAPLRQSMERWEPYVRQNGSTPEQAFENLMQTEYVLRTGTPDAKRNMLLNVARTYGVELGQQQAQQAQYDPDDPIAAHPFVQQIQAELEATKQQNQQIMGSLQNWQSSQQQQAAMSGNQAIEAFRNEKDASGKPAHPYFDEVVDAMVALATAEKQRGKTPVLNELYEQAIWANPETRAKIQSAEQHVAKQAEAKRKREEAEKARKAGVSVSGSPSSPQVKPKSLDETVAEAMGA